MLQIPVLSEAARGLVNTVENFRKDYQDDSLHRPFSVFLPLSDEPKVVCMMTQVIDHYAAKGWGHYIQYCRGLIDGEYRWNLILCEQRWYLVNLLSQTAVYR